MQTGLGSFKEEPFYLLTNCLKSLDCFASDTCWNLFQCDGNQTFYSPAKFMQAIINDMNYRKFWVFQIDNFGFDGIFLIDWLRITLTAAHTTDDIRSLVVTFNLSLCIEFPNVWREELPDSIEALESWTSIPDTRFWISFYSIK